MNNWRLLIFAIVAVLLPSESFTERSLFDGREECCAHRSDRALETFKLYGPAREIYQDRRLTPIVSRESRLSNSRYGNSLLERSTNRASVARAAITDSDNRFDRAYRTARIQERRQRTVGIRENRDIRSPAVNTLNRDEILSLELRNRYKISSTQARTTRIGMENLRISHDRRNIEENRNSNSDARFERSPGRDRVLGLSTERDAKNRQSRENVHELRRLSERAELRLISRETERSNEHRQLRDSTRNEILRELNARRDIRDSRMSLQRNIRDTTERLNREQRDVRMVRFQETRDGNRRSISEGRRSIYRDTISLSRQQQELRAQERNEMSNRATRMVDKRNSATRRVVDSNTFRNSENARSDERRAERLNERDGERNLRSRVMSRRESETVSGQRSSSLSRVDNENLRREREMRTDENRESRNRLLGRSSDMNLNRRYSPQQNSLRDARLKSENRRQLSDLSFRNEIKTERNDQKYGDRQLERSGWDFNSRVRSEFRNIRETLHRESREREEVNNVRGVRPFAGRISELRFESQRNARDVRDDIRREIRSNERDNLRLAYDRNLRARELNMRVRDSRTVSTRGEESRREQNIRTRDSRNAVTERQELRMAVQSSISHLEMERSFASRLSNLLQHRSRNPESLMIREKLQTVDEKSENQYNGSISYVFYTLQGAYLCGLLIQMLTENSKKTKARNFSWWFNSPKSLIKAD